MRKALIVLTLSAIIYIHSIAGAITNIILISTDLAGFRSTTIPPLYFPNLRKPDRREAWQIHARKHLDIDWLDWRANPEPPCSRQMPLDWQMLLPHEYIAPSESKLPSSGDWVVFDEELYKDETIVLTGNLIIRPGGELTLVNCTLLINCTYDGEWQIKVESGGMMNVLAGSNITACDSDHEFLFYVYGQLIMRDSFLSECGYDDDHPGLWLETDGNVLLKNTTITNCYYGVCCYGFQSRITISDCEINNNLQCGVYCYCASHVALLGCEINNNGAYGIHCEYADYNVTISDCVISDNGCGMYCFSSSNVDVSSCRISDNGDGVICLSASNINIVECDINNNEWYGIYCVDSSNVEVHYCSIYSNFWHGLYNEGYFVVNASYCWWGGPYGPEYNEAGDPEDPEEVYSYYGLEYLIYEPWMAEPPIDLTPPKIIITNPSEGDIVFGTVLITVDASDISGIANVTFYIDETLAFVDENAPYEYEWNSTSVADGKHNIKVIAFDEVGNRAETSVTITVDNTPPVLSQCSLRFLSKTALGNTIVVSQLPDRSRIGFSFLPAYVRVMVSLSLSLTDYEKLIGKEATFLIDDEPIETIVINDPQHISVILTLSLTPGFHELYFRLAYGSDTLTYKLADIAAYESVFQDKHAFNVTRDAYRFRNWRLGWETFYELAVWLMEEYGIPEKLLMLLYPISATGGHCFGMAYTASAFFTGMLAKPKDANVYAFAKEEVSRLIAMYQITQLYIIYHYGEEMRSLEAFNEIKGLVNKGIPPVICTANHAVACIGYYEVGDNRFLVIYDNNSPNCTNIWRVYDDYVDAFDLGRQERLVVVKPLEKLAEIEFSKLIKIIRDSIIMVVQESVNLILRCPVDIIITSEVGTVKIVDDAVVENSIEGSYIYVSGDVKIVLLPEDLKYDVSVIGREESGLSITSTCLINNTIMIYDYIVNIIRNSTLVFSIGKDKPPREVSVDVDGDGIPDVTVKPEKSRVPMHPMITITYPKEGAIIESDSLTVSWNVRPGFYVVKKIEIRLDNGSWIDVTTTTNYTFIRISEGKHIITIRLTDESENITEDSVSFVVRLPSGYDILMLVAAMFTIIVVLTIICRWKKRRRTSNDTHEL